MSRLEDRTRTTPAQGLAAQATEPVRKPSAAQQPIVYIDLTHLGRHVTGLERVSIEQFEAVTFAGADVRHVRASDWGRLIIVSMILRQQLWLPLLAVIHPRATFVFPGFPPSPLFTLIPHRVVMYVHDLFLITRPSELSLKARLYMAPAFRIALRRLSRFLVNSQKTRAELAPHVRAGATVDIYRPNVRNVFALALCKASTTEAADSVTHRRPLRLVALGTVEPRKNYAAAVRILDALNARGNPGATRELGGFVGAELHILGRTGWGDAAATVANHPRVTVHGYAPADTVKAVLESADVYLCTAHDEGLGLPLLEAQYAGLAFVAPDQPVFREVLGASGVFVDPTNPDACATAVANLVTTPGWRDTHAAAATANVARWNALASYDAERVVAMFNDRKPN